jgi:hypothetical protein
MIALLLVAVLSKQCALAYEGKQVYIVTTSKTTSYAYHVRVFVDGKIQPRAWQGVIRPGKRKLVGKKGTRGLWTFKVDKCKKATSQR